jgi:Zn-dependent peptidase ImmA (M78 family)/transcriptional regulator with XRE-family HTH domain
MNNRFNPEMLQLARQFRGVSQIALAKATGITQGYLSKIENGLIEPGEDTLEILSRVLSFPQVHFFNQDRVYGLPISVHAYRKKASVPQKTLDSVQAEMNLRMMHYRKLLRSVDISKEYELPYLDIEQYGGDAEEIASLVRRTWMMPNGPVKNLIDFVERAGVLIFVCDFPDGKVDGVTMAVKGMPPCIFLSKNQPADRMRFSLAHELGHLIMHRQPSPSMEDEANKFAAAFLMPSKDIYYDLKYASIKSLAALKPVWKVSIAALLYRSITIGAITKSQGDYMWRQLSSMGFRLREPSELDFPHESAALTTDVLEVHMEDLGYSHEEMMSTLGLVATDFRKLYQLESKPRFHIVK